MYNFLPLSVLLFPLVALFLITFIPFSKEKTKLVSLFFMLLHFLLSLPLYFLYDAKGPTLQGETNFPLITSWGANFHIGIDGLNLFLILLTTLLGPLVVWASYCAIEKRERLFFSMVFLLQFFMIGTFLAQNLFLFYIFWEAMLIPMFFIIGIWGGPNRFYATVKFFLYTALGSILMLVGIIWLLHAYILSTQTPSLEFSHLYTLSIPFGTELWLFLAFFFSFAIKVPLIPFHTWLPDAHVEAPTAGSAILAGILLKMGTYGIIKLAFPLFPHAASYLSNIIGILAALSILYGAFLAFSHGDIKKIIACSSISHLGFVVLGLVSFNLIATQGAMMQMIGHGLSSAGLFFIVGMIYERLHTRELSHFGGIAKSMPTYATSSLIIILASLGLPLTSSFTGEFLILFGYFQTALKTLNPLHITLAILSSLGVIFSALYMLRLAQHFLFGPTTPKTENLIDINLREKTILATLIVFIFFLGIYPKPILDKMEKTVSTYIELATKK